MTRDQRKLVATARKAARIRKRLDRLVPARLQRRKSPKVHNKVPIYDGTKWKLVSIPIRNSRA